MIIGILVAIAIPVFNNVQRNAADRAHEANLRTLLGAGQMAVASGGNSSRVDGVNQRHRSTPRELIPRHMADIASGSFIGSNCN